MKSIHLSLLMLVLTLALSAGCQAPASPPPPTQEPAEPAQPTQPAIANPASENCLAQGGTLSIETRGDGGQFGVCYFEDNRQCEEWALLRAECPVGGVGVAGFATPAGRYCAITGGSYAASPGSSGDQEQGSCAFPDGSQCDAWAYFNGQCQPGAEAVGWQTITNQQAGFSLQIPLTWGELILPDQADGSLHGEAFTGPEGGLEVYWGTGFGGACPSGTVPVQLAQGPLEACYSEHGDGTSEWSQVGYQVEGGNSFSVRLYTNDADPASRDLVLKVLSTLAFTLPEPAPTGPTIVPLVVEVCNGQAQAMAHALDVLEVTQSEAPLADSVTGLQGTGCLATVMSTGLQFENPGVPLAALDSMLVGQGWAEDPQLSSGGPTGLGAGYRKDQQICLAAAVWQPDAAVSCPADRPITDCSMQPEQQIYTITLNCGQEIP